MSHSYDVSTTDTEPVKNMLGFVFHNTALQSLLPLALPSKWEQCLRKTLNQTLRTNAWWPSTYLRTPSVSRSEQCFNFQAHSIHDLSAETAKKVFMPTTIILVSVTQTPDCKKPAGNHHIISQSSQNDLQCNINLSLYQPMPVLSQWPWDERFCISALRSLSHTVLPHNVFLTVLRITLMWYIY